MFNLIDLTPFINYMERNHPKDWLTKILNNGNIKIAQEDNKYLLVFASDNLCSDTKRRNIGIKKLFKEVLNVDCEIEYITDNDGKYLTPLEREILQNKKKEEEERLNEERKERHNGKVKYLFSISRIPESKAQSFTFDNYKSIKENTKSIETIKEYLTGFLTICGATGLGKTHLAIAVGSKFINKELTVIYYQVEDLLDTLRHSYDKEDSYGQNSYDKTMNQLKDCDLLILDDFGTQKNTDWVLSKLDTIIDSRYVNDKSTIITSNLSLKSIGDVSERIASRLSSGTVITLSGSDYRATHKVKIEKLPAKKKQIGEW